MPTYEYRCTKCGHEYEEYQSITAEPVSRCPKCKARAKRLIGTGAGILFKGDGFYQTDYRSEGYKKQSKDESSASAGKSSDAAKSGDAGKSGDSGKSESGKSDGGGKSDAAAKPGSGGGAGGASEAAAAAKTPSTKDAKSKRKKDA